MADVLSACEFCDLDIVGAEFIWSTGVTPSVCLIRCIPCSCGNLFGDLVFRYGKLKLRFPEAIAEHVSVYMREDMQGRFLWEIAVLDRRWKWRYGEISGRYNVRLPNGTIEPDTKKTPIELATLLLSAMGEKGYSISALPSKEPNPEVNWDKANPAKELAKLAEQFGCVVTLSLSNKVKLWKIGDGPNLPQNEDYRHEPNLVKEQIRPKTMKVVGAPISVQGWLKLTAVGIEHETAAREPLTGLSYKPALGWGYESPVCFGGVAADKRWLAFQSVWKYYLVTGLSSGYTIPGINNVNVLDPRQILPIEKNLSEAQHWVPGTRIDYQMPGRPLVGGKFSLYGYAQGNSALKDATTNQLTPYHDDTFTLRRDKGIVVFNQPVFQYTDGLREDAEIYLWCGFPVRKTVDSPPLRYERSRQVSTTSPSVRLSGTQVMWRPDLKRVIRVTYNGAFPTGSVDNVTDVDKLADVYLTEMERRHLALPYWEMEYAGLQAIELTGKVKQVQWQCGTDYPTLTKASKFRETNIGEQDEQVRRRLERVDQMLETEL